MSHTRDLRGHLLHTVTFLVSFSFLLSKRLHPIKGAIVDSVDIDRASQIEVSDQHP